MFTGLIDNVGKSICIYKLRNVFRIKLTTFYTKGLCLGDSVSLNGICLTVTFIDLLKNLLIMEVVKETFYRTNIIFLSIINFVNIEYSLKFGGYLGGHIIQGHTDKVGKIIFLKKINKGWLFNIFIAGFLIKYLTRKGFVTIDGASITICNIFLKFFSIFIVPFTFKKCCFKYYFLGKKINLEFDIISKYFVEFNKKYVK